MEWINNAWRKKNNSNIKKKESKQNKNNNAEITKTKNRKPPQFRDYTCVLFFIIDTIIRALNSFLFTSSIV